MSKAKEEFTIEDEIREAMAANLENQGDEPQEENTEINQPEENQPENQPQEENTPAQPVEAKAETVQQPEDTAPVSLTSAIKAKWNELPADVRAEWKKREDDIHRMMTAKDGDLNFGRTIKDIAKPYEAIIRAEGGTVDGAFKDLLNTAYILRTGSPQQKAQLLLQTAEQFGVDLRPYVGAPQSQHNPITALQREIEFLRQKQVDPEQIKRQLQDDMVRANIESEIEAFAANPANKYFEEVKPIMGSLIASGKAKNLQEAYDSALWSVPSIRVELEAKAKTADAEKKKAEMAAKKKAAASVAGSPGLASPNANAPQKSLEDELRDQLRASQGKI